MLRYNIFFFILLFSSTLVRSQPIDNTAAYRNIHSTNYIRFYYDNDFFTAMDYYYTQGINLEIVNPKLHKFPISKLLIRPAKSEIKYGIALEHIGYTPYSIRHNEILYGDRPFAASLSLKTFAISVDTVNHWRLSSTLNVGIIGPAASGQWMQKTIHRNLNNIEPLGWSNQIHNDLLLNYNVAHEQLLLSHKKLFALSTYSQIALGTLHDKASVGIDIMVGHFNNAFNSNSLKKNFQLLIYSKPTISFIGYDATLQGGLFNHSSPYTIASKNISRITFEGEAGIALQFSIVYLEYFQSIISKEFKTERYHRWGGIRLGVTF